MVVTTIVSTSCVSVGEALRLIDYRDVIQNDFILVSGDTVSNVNLAPIIKAHKDRRAVDKQAIFTMVGTLARRRALTAAFSPNRCCPWAG